MMKKITLVILLLMLLLATPALANPNQPTGEQINIYLSGVQEYPADTAFYIRHGWAQEPVDNPIGKFDFKLEVDGVWVKESYVERSIMKGEDGPLFDISWVFNFPNGMSGVHTFRGHWYEPCQAALEDGIVSECKKQNAPIEVRTTEVQLTFISP